jgi:hypothetical protein
LNTVNNKLLEYAKNILAKNWNGRFAIASSTLYPHQWSWDSCFIALGKSYFNVEQAMKEMESLLQPALVIDMIMNKGIGIAP